MKKEEKKSIEVKVVEYVVEDTPINGKIVVKHYI